MTVQDSLEDGIRIRLLGDLQVVRAGRTVPLPASKRTRALLGYLVVLGAPQTRTHLCDLLWDGPDDPRAALRWSLTKLRPVVNDTRVPRLEADRERVQFLPRRAHVDAIRVGELLAKGVGEAVRLQALEEAASLLQGEFLDGLDLPRCYRFHHWCMAERERYGSLRRQVLTALAERLEQEPERALPHVHALVAADPLSETAHALLVRVLAQAGREREAEVHYRYARDLLQRELAAPLSGELRLPTVGRAPSRETGQATSAEASPLPRADTSIDLPVRFVGHAAGRRKIDAALRSLSSASKRPMLLFAGEPGIGKSRLLGMTADEATAAGARVVSARCFEAEMVRPYAIWLDALRVVRPDQIPERSKRDLAVLRPSSELAAPEDGSRTRLFAAVAELVEELARDRPLVVALDDLQWIDEASAALLHFLVRSCDRSPVLFAAAARRDEIDDNPWAKRLLRSLERDRCLDEVHLGPLTLEDTAALLGPGAAESDIAAAHRGSGGNPLFILELARARQRGSGTDGRALGTLIDERVERLEPAVREVVACAAAVGRAFSPQILAAVLGTPEAELLGRLETLERRCLLRPASEGHFDFAHDLVRQAVYRKMSQPRRRLIHGRIAAALAAAAAHDGSLQGDLVHHAGLAGDYALAARACVAAGDRCLRMFANLDADAVAERGLAYLERIAPGSQRTLLQIDLLNVKVWAGFHTLAATDPANARTAQLLRKAADEAEVLRLAEHAASAHQLISWLAYRSNDSDKAHAAALDAERTSKTADDATRCAHLARTGRCLLDVEAEVERARRFLEEARRLAADQNLRIVELEWGLGLVARWDGDLVRARDLTTRAVALARVREERWRELECLLWLAKIDLELQRCDDAIAHCDEAVRLATLIGIAHAPVARALRLLAERHKPDRGSARGNDRVLVDLRDFDDKANLAYILNGCAAYELERGKTEHAQSLAHEALAAASAVGRVTEVAVARAALARIAHAVGDGNELARQVAALTSLGDPRRLSARARSQLKLVLTSFPTLVQTQAR